MNTWLTFKVTSTKRVNNMEALILTIVFIIWIAAFYKILTKPVVKMEKFKGRVIDAKNDHLTKNLKGE